MNSKVVVLSLVAAAGVYVGWGVNRMLTIKPIENLDAPEEIVKALNEHEEAREIDEGRADSEVALSYIHLGDLSIACPTCGAQVDVVGVGVSTVEDRETETNKYGLNELSMLGVFYFPCSHLIYSPCFVEKASLILNAEEVGKLSPGLFDDLVNCGEHAHGST